jgi:hypothetical protein
MDNEAKEFLRRTAESNEHILAELTRPKSKVQKLSIFCLRRSVLVVEYPSWTRSLAL